MTKENKTAWATFIDKEGIRHDPIKVIKNKGFWINESFNFCASNLGVSEHSSIKIFDREEPITSFVAYSKKEVNIFILGVRAGFRKIKENIQSEINDEYDVGLK